MLQIPLTAPYLFTFDTSKFAEENRVPFQRGDWTGVKWSSQSRKINFLTLPDLALGFVHKRSGNEISLRYPYSHSRKTVNTRENFWNVYCFATNQKRDETAENNRQTAAWTSHFETTSWVFLPRQIFNFTVFKY